MTPTLDPVCRLSFALRGAREPLRIVIPTARCGDVSKEVADQQSAFMEIRSADGYLYLVQRASILQILISEQPTTHEASTREPFPSDNPIELYFDDGTAEIVYGDTPISALEFVVALARAQRGEDGFAALPAPGDRLHLVHFTALRFCITPTSIFERGAREAGLTTTAMLGADVLRQTAERVGPKPA